MPEAEMQLVTTANTISDYFLSIGTSTVVYPSAALPPEASRRGATEVKINPLFTPFTAQQCYVIAGAVLRIAIQTEGFDARVKRPKMFKTLAVLRASATTCPLSMNRRHFLGTIASGLIASPLLAATQLKGLPVRTLGRTGIKVPILGFGSGSRFLMYREDDQAIAALNRAIDLGITYIDTAHSYGDGKSEERVGRVMTTRRHEVVLATKIAARTADEARRQIELSLKRLHTDHLEVLHIHALKNMKDLEAIEARGGVLEAFYEARDQKITRAIGITCHADPLALQTALERHDFDCTQMALNAGLASMTDGMKIVPAGPASFERLALPVATRKKMGVIAMKVFGQEQLVGAATPEKLLAYALSLPVSLASVGMPRPELIERNAALAHAFKPLSQRERNRIVDAIETGRKFAMHQFFRDHEDV